MTADRINPLPAHALSSPAEFWYSTYSIGVGPSNKVTHCPPGTEIDDLFRPQFWVHHAKRFKTGDLVRVRSIDGAWDVMLTVVTVASGAVVMEPWPKLPAGLDMAQFAHNADLARRTLVQTTVAGKVVPRVEFTKATGWRVIDLAGTEHSRNHQSEFDASAALRLYVNKLGFSDLKPLHEPAPAPRPDALAEVLASVPRTAEPEAKAKPPTAPAPAKRAS